MELNLTNLIDMYLIHSPSRREEKLSSYVVSLLDQMGIEYNLDGNMIYSIEPDKPMICAHLDQVNHVKHATKAIIQNNVISGNGNLGADDKNGVYICLKLLELFGDQINFVFTEQEECGGMIHEFFTELEKSDKKLLDSIPYCLVFDRRNGKDIIGTYNGYCESDLETDIEKIAKDNEFAYRSHWGVWSDCDNISSWIPCVNLSCGYYGAHTDEEYSKIHEINRAYDFGVLLLENLSGNYDKPQTFWHYWKGFKKKSRFSMSWDDDYPAYGQGSQDWSKTYTYDKDGKIIETEYYDRDNFSGYDDSVEFYMDDEMDNPLDDYEYCPNCFENDFIVDSGYEIAENYCYNCGCVFDDLLRAHWFESYNDWAESEGII